MREQAVSQPLEDALKRVLSQGFAAFIDGVARESNPYIEAGMFHTEWCKGWDMAQKQQREFYE